MSHVVPDEIDHEPAPMHGPFWLYTSAMDDILDPDSGFTVTEHQAMSTGKHDCESVLYVRDRRQWTDAELLAKFDVELKSIGCAAGVSGIQRHVTREDA